MDLNSLRLAEIIHNERLAEAAEARQWAQYSVSSSLPDRLRAALGKRLITWGERLTISTAPVEAHV